MTHRVLVAGLVHETHTFLAQSTDLTGFEALVWVRGQQMLDRCRGDASPMGGALEVADASGWQVIPSRYGAAIPSGTI
ncbi:uncharacterized protein METZ01_LOCUS241588 [marine metagenome]|uniref:Microcystin LR degradation protein MlrC N-terminal domain-containing protein n=1 Tax=marine metagenome TaxID=408172 RepID=A0A382HMW5_9ZZZZ